MNKVSKYLIYALHHPDSLRVYVGKSSSGMVRPRTHGTPWHLKKYPQFPVVRWINKHRAAEEGWNYQITVLEECASAAVLDEAERFYIAYFRMTGMLLLNCTDGGEGTSGYTHTEISRRRMSEAQKQAYANLSENQKAALRAKMSAALNRPEVRANMSIAQRKAYAEMSEAQRIVFHSRLKFSWQGRKHKAETLAKMSARQMGRKRSPAAIAKVAAALRGRNASEEARTKMKASWTEERRAAKSEELRRRVPTEAVLSMLLANAKKPRSAAHRAKIGEANKRRVWTAESRAKIGAWRSGFKQPLDRWRSPRMRINLLMEPQ